MVEELFNGNLACDMNLSQAILDGILPMARYVCGVYSYEKDTDSLNKKIEKSFNSEEEKKELLRKVKILKENLDRSNGVSDIFRKYIMTGNEKFVVFLKDTKHLRRMRPAIKKWFTDAGFSSLRMYEVHSKNIDKDKEFQAFKDDTEEGIKLCLSVNMLAEGLHKDINGVIMLRETASPNLYFQMIGRAFACGKKTIPLIFDLVANSQFISETADNFPNELRGEIERRKKECEKEGRDYEVGFDVDEFIVMDQFMDVVSGFKEIEGKLQGSWENGLKHFDKYVEKHNGDVLVPKAYIDEDGFPLGNWVSNRRRELDSLPEYKIVELNKRGFVWDPHKYKFEKNVKAIAKYYRENGKYPSQRSEDSEIKKLGHFITNEKIVMRDKNSIYPEWKMEILDKYLLDFSYETRTDKAFNKFIYYAKLYKERYGHLDIQYRDTIDGYKIGNNRRTLSKCKFLSENQKKELKDLGVYLGSKIEKQFNDKMDLAKQAIEDGVIIDKINLKYKDENLYNWIKNTIKKRYRNKRLSLEEIQVVERLTGKSLDELCCRKDTIKVKVVDILENKEVGIFESQSEAMKIMRERYDIKASDNIISYRLKGKTRKPYKGRFMFYRVDENEEVAE